MNDIELWHGDCLVEMNRIESGSVDAIICDLPYQVTACKWDKMIPLEPLWKHYKRVIKPHGAVVLFGAGVFPMLLWESNKKWYKYSWVWKKNQPTGIGTAKHRPMRCTEDILIFYKQFGTYNRQPTKSQITDRKLGGSNGKFTARYSGSVGIAKLKKPNNPDNILRKKVNPRNLLEFNVVPHAKGTLHPTQKPLDLLTYLIRTYTNPGDLVLDNAMGSGTTGHACVNLGRRFIGIEKELEYYDIAVERIAKARIAAHQLELI